MNNTLALLMTGKDGKPLFATRRIVYNFALLVMCSQFAFAVLAMKGAFLPQLLELWQISKTQFGLLMSIYGICHNILYVGLSWAQDRFAPRLLISANLVMGGITTFFLGQTSDFATLCFLFVMLALWCEGAFWPAVIASVRKSTSDSNQAKIFGLLEGGRGCVELAQNALTVALYAALGYSLLGLEVAFMVNGVILMVLGVTSWFMLPSDTLLKSRNDSASANREVKAGMLTTLTQPEVWLAGLTGFMIYVAYTTMPYFLTYLDDLFLLPAVAISIFGIASTSGGRITIALPAGFIADRFFGGPSGAMRFGLGLTAALSLGMVLLPTDTGNYVPAMAMMIGLAFTFFFMRALYFAPFGEMGLPPRFSGSVIAVASFVIYLPATFAYGVFGALLDARPGAEGYQLMFGGLVAVGVVGMLVATLLKRRIDGGAAERISARVSAIDAKLGLMGDERTLADESR